MNAKTLTTLEFPKILARLSAYAAFSASAELGLALKPTSRLELARTRQARTREARLLLSSSDLSFSGASDLRPLVSLACRDGVLEVTDFLAIKSTLIVARSAQRVLSERAQDAPNLADMAVALPTGLGLVDSITKTISERGEVLDSASEALGRIRSELKITFERLMARLERYLSEPNSAKLLQEAIITQRSGRYVLPLRAEFKGRIKAVIHDQSASGATLFIEPLAVVEWNNRYKELQLDERDEIQRILFALSQKVVENSQVLQDMVGAMADLDLACMCAKYADDLRASEPELLPFKAESKGEHPGSTLHLVHARHPLLDPEKVVPIDVVLDDETYALIITGPNTGGKTVTLKTIGLLALMAQSGMQIPAQSGSKISVFKDIFADIGDEQSIEQSLSTFSGHITQLVSILKRADAQSLVLLDELGAGTDPQEGSALAMAVLTHLLERGITCMVATHYPELKAYAHTTPHVVNASVEFDLQTLKPTYRLTIGLPGRSNALLIAEKLGLPMPIIEAAKAGVDPADLRAEDLLEEIHRQRDAAIKSSQAAATMQKEAEMRLKEIDTQHERIEDERIAILEKAREQVKREGEAFQQEIDALRRELAKARQPLEVINAVEEKAEELTEIVQEPIERKMPARQRSKKQSGPLRLGERIYVNTLGQYGIISALSENGVEVQVGVLRVRARRADVTRKTYFLDETEETETPSDMPHKKGSLSLPSVDSPGVELDIRGQRVEEAVESLQRYLERAYLSGLPYVRIIHGKGTGKLRQAIRTAIQVNPHVSRWEGGVEAEGGDGVTVAFLRTA